MQEKDHSGIVLKGLWLYIRFVMGCLREGRKERKERGQAGLGRKNEKKRCKRSPVGPCIRKQFNRFLIGCLDLQEY